MTGDGTSTFTYDANGNRTNTGYSTGTGNRLLSDGTWNFSYDDEGNMTKKVNIATDETWTYGYDHRNQLIWAEQREEDEGTLEQRVEFKYDVLANRQEKKVDANGNGTFDTTQKYAYDGWKTGQQGWFVGNENYDVFADLDGSGSLTTRYFRGDVIDQVFARLEGTTPYWYLTDHLGSIRDVTDGAGVVKNDMTYDAFGNILSETDSAYRGRYAWTGREFDVETDLQYNRARYYDAKIGRWISRDPLGFEAGDGNLYRYAYNRPAATTDPSGLKDVEVTRIGDPNTVGIQGAGAGLLTALDANTITNPYTILAGFAKGKIEQTFGPMYKDWHIPIPDFSEPGFVVFRSPKNVAAKEGTIVGANYLFFVSWYVSGDEKSIGFRVTNRADIRRGQGNPFKIGKMETSTVDPWTPKQPNAWTISKLKTPVGKACHILVYVDSPGSVAITQTIPKKLGLNKEDIPPTDYELSEVQIIELFNKKTGEILDRRAIIFNMQISERGEPSIMFIGPGDPAHQNLEKVK